MNRTRLLGELWAMYGKLAMGMAALFAAWLSAAPAQADGPGAPPYAYTNRLAYSAGYFETRPAEQIARDAAAADAAEAGCAAADMAACTALGEAFLQGTGRPLNRPVAELVLRRACNGAEGGGCYLLAELLGGAFDTDAARAEELVFTARACVLGSSDGCLKQAGHIESGFYEGLGRADAMALRRDACARGMSPVCVDLGGRLAESDGDPASRAEGRGLLDRLCEAGNADACVALAWWLGRSTDSPADTARAAALLDRQCRAGDARSCNIAAGKVRDSAGPADPRFAEYHGLGCIAGDTMACLFAGRAAGRSGEAGRLAAAGFYDRACPDYPSACATAADLRAAPAVGAACEAGDQRACVTLGTWMAEDEGPFEDQPRAAALLGKACDVGEIAGCLPAGRLLIEAPGSETDSETAIRIDAYLSRACAAGVGEACITLATALGEGKVLAQDIPRALALTAESCDAGDRAACDEIAMREEDDPAVPVVLATNLTPPDALPEAIGAAQMMAVQAEVDDFRRRTCTTSAVVWEGVEYADGACLGISQAIGGFTVNRVELAPFQALLWRPEVLGQQRIGYRAACGGSVVATGWIITAAHCTYDLGVRIEEHDYRIRLGVIRPDAPEGNTYPILKVIRHPDFSPATFQFDIALVQYDPARGTRGDFGFGARRITVDRRSPQERPVRAKAPVYAFGWGRQALDDPAPAKVLQGVRLELEDAATCTGRTAYRDWRKDSVLCAMGPKREQACTGDSGGPLVTYEDRQGVPTLIGVVSSGEQCSTTGIPSRYIRIGHPAVQQWLRDNLPGFRQGAPQTQAR
ncbi:trypsin-like serine protease [Porphyrobacter sp. AAP82]|uniref:trypsin-like serine protease n=1 Tax=Porphyrobacter sp. AAP82 TaxID=1248917 RepID=UPI0018C8CAB4|nr:trypsin-like serine protease [Porphyrobacter sp. AAP82]